ncbi:1-aminocyclopropane-1-carboxylate deaminase/D-cysteine desulfhydrase [Aquirufa beregesia]|nr:pyridoxal-phosphate dependent enzyme [Aquirufa beregesia]
MDISAFEKNYLQLPSPIDELFDPLWKEQNIRLFFKRDDLIHPTVSGNKWRKLKEYIRIAQDNPKKGIISFGGAYSNHLYALAYVANLLQIPSIGIVRGEELTTKSNAYLSQMEAMGMELYFVDRGYYRKKEVPNQINSEDYWIIPEGGYSSHGIDGMKALVDEIQQGIQPDFLISAVGTGTTILGLAKYSKVNTLGVLCLNNEKEIEKHLHELQLELTKLYLAKDYLFGKYASRPPELMNFCEKFKQQHHIEIEPTYTGKMMYGVYDLLKKKYFPAGSTLVCIHTGGIK